MEELDKEILIKASQGDMRAFEEVYKACNSFVYNVAYRVVNNREDAMEVAQEVFLIMHQKLKTFRFESSFKTWAYRITANTAINFAKKNSKNKSVPFEEEFGQGAVENEAQAHLDQEQQSQQVEKLLAELNPEQRACVVLRDIQGLSYEEIAQALKININTVRSRLKRSREKLLSLKKVFYLASLIVMVLIGSVSLNTLQVEQAQNREQGEYLVSVLGASTPSENNDLGTPIEHYFL